MRIQRFEVQGYKNLSKPLVLDDLGPIVSIYGDNGVGKSNLVEALVAAVQVLLVDGYGGQTLRDGLKVEWPFQLGGYPTWKSEVLHVSSGAPVALGVSVEASLAPEDVVHIFQRGRLLVRSTLVMTTPGAGPTVARAEQTNNLVHENVTLGSKPWSALTTAGWNDKTRPNLFEHPANGTPHSKRAGGRIIAVIQLDRSFLGDGVAERHHDRGIIPNHLALALNDLRDSRDAAERRRWEAFVRHAGSLAEVTGNGRINLIFDREKLRAELVLDTPNARLPIHLLGSGAQQLLALLAAVLTAGTPIVAIEEPELNLRADRQRMLLELLQRLVDDPDGPSQFFLTTHSPAFATRDAFWLKATPEGPEIQRVGIEQVAKVAQVSALGVPPVLGDALTGFVEPDGATRLPAFALAHLGMTHGGGVVVSPNEQPGSVTVWSDEAWVAAFGLGAAEP